MFRRQSSPLIEFSIVLAICAGAMYLLGSAYFEGYYSAFNIPHEIIKIDVNTIVAWGSAVLFAWVLAAIGGVTALAVLFKIYSKKHGFQFQVDVTTVTLGIVPLGVICGVFFQYQEGHKNGVVKIETFAPLVKITYANKSNEYNGNKYGLITINNGHIFVFVPSKNGTRKPNVIIIPESMVEALEIIGNVSDYDASQP